MEVSPPTPYNDVRLLPGVLAFDAFHNSHREHHAIHPDALLPQLPPYKNHNTPCEDGGKHIAEDN